MRRVINEKSERKEELGHLTLDELINDSDHWNFIGDHDANDPYYELTNPEDKNEFGELTLKDLVSIADYTVDNDIPDAHIDLHDLLADHILTNKDFLVLVDLLQEVFDDIKSVADVFDQLADVESVIELFLPKLGYLLNYKYNYDIPGYVNRDIIKRLLWLYEQKATDKDVLESADYGSNEKWVGSTLFMPDAVPEDRTAEVYYPVNGLFTHDVSAHSRTDRYPDSERWRGGVIVIKVKKLNDKIREAVKRVLPAGLKVYYDFEGSLGGDGQGGSVDFGSWIMDYEDTLIDYQIPMKDRITSQWFDGNYFDKHFLSGRQILFYDGILDYIQGVSWLTPLPEDDPEGNVTHDPDDFTYEVPAPKRTWKGYAEYSKRGKLSGKLRLVGEGGQTFTQTPIEPVLPTDVYYPVKEVLDLRVNPWINDSRYHQMYLGYDMFAMNSYFDTPDHFKPSDLIETGFKQTVRFDEIVVEDHLVNGLLPRTYSNDFYLENYNEPFELYKSKQKRFELDQADFSVADDIPIDLIDDRTMFIDRQTIHSDVFDGQRFLGHIFSGRGLDYVDLMLDIIREPKLRIELILDHEDARSTPFDEDETVYGEVRSGPDWFWTFPFEYSTEQPIELYIERDPDYPFSTRFDEDDTVQGEVRSGLPDDYQFPFEIEAALGPRVIELWVERTTDTTTVSGEDTYKGEVRSGEPIDYADPFYVKKFGYNRLTFGDMVDFTADDPSAEQEVSLERQLPYDVTETEGFEVVSFKPVAIELILDEEPISETGGFEFDVFKNVELSRTRTQSQFWEDSVGSDTFDGEPTDKGDVRSGIDMFETYPFEFRETGTREIDFRIEKFDLHSTTLSGEDTYYGDVRSGEDDFQTGPIEITIDTRSKGDE